MCLEQATWRPLIAETRKGTFHAHPDRVYPHIYRFTCCKSISHSKARSENATCRRLACLPADTFTKVGKGGPDRRFRINKNGRFLIEGGVGVGVTISGQLGSVFNEMGVLVLALLLPLLIMYHHFLGQLSFESRPDSAHYLSMHNLSLFFIIELQES